MTISSLKYYSSLGVTLETIIKFAKEYLKDKNPIHGIRHAEIAANYASLICEEEKVDKRMGIIATWLHDIGRSEEWVRENIKNNHGIKSADITRQFLVSLEIEEDYVEEVCTAISLHCFPNIQKTKLAKILWDADKLCVFAKEMEQDYLEYWTNKLGSLSKAKSQIMKERKFYFKTFYTKIAKQIAYKFI